MGKYDLNTRDGQEYNIYEMIHGAKADETVCQPQPPPCPVCDLR